MADDDKTNTTDRDPATLGSVPNDPNTDLFVNSALHYVVKMQLFPQQKFLHPQDLAYSDAKNSLCSCIRHWVSAPKESAQAWWARSTPIVASAVTQYRNTKSTAVKNNFMSKLLF